MQAGYRHVIEGLYTCCNSSKSVNSYNFQRTVFVLCLPRRLGVNIVRGRQKTQNIAPRTGTATFNAASDVGLFSLRRGSHLSGAFLNKGDINSREIAQTQRAPHTCKTYSKLWKSVRFNEMGEKFLEVGAMLRPVGVYHVSVFSN